MQVTLTRIGPYGVQTDQHGEKWVSNGSKKFGPVVNLKEFSVGDVVDLEVKENGEYINLKGMVKVGGAAKSSTPNIPSAGTQSIPKSSSASSARETAVKAVLGSPILAAQLQSVDISDAISQAKDLIVRVEGYILSGKFEVPNNETEAN